jgi:hypothetical protein
MRIGTRRSSAPRRTASSMSRHALHLDEVPHVRDEHDAVPRRDPEERDEADERRHRQHPALDVDAHDGADEREREVQHDEERVARRSEREREEPEDAEDREAPDEDDGARRSLGALELPAVHDPVAGRERHRAPYRGAEVADDAPHVAPGDVAAHDQSSLDALATDLMGGAVAAHVGEHPERHLRATRRQDEHVAEGLDRGSARRVEARDEFEDGAALGDLGDGVRPW